MNGQVQRHYRVTAVNRGKCLGVITRLCIGGACPSIGVTVGVGKLCGVSMVDSQVQRHNGIAAYDILKVLHIVTGLCIGDSVPLEAFASRLREAGLGSRTAQGSEDHTFTIHRSEAIGGVCAEVVGGMLRETYKHSHEGLRRRGRRDMTVGQGGLGSRTPAETTVGDVRIAIKNQMADTGGRELRDSHHGVGDHHRQLRGGIQLDGNVIQKQPVLVTAVVVTEGNIYCLSDVVTQGD